VYPGSDGAPVMAYSGTHETSKFGERDSGNVLIVEITSPGSPPTITPIHTGSLIWKSIDKEVREPGDLRCVREDIEAMKDASDTLIEVRLVGLLMAEERLEIERIQQILASRFLSGRMDVSCLRPSPDDDSWISALPPGIIRQAASRLRAIADSSEELSETAARALMDLYTIAGDVVQ
jgi:hypothetical protein